MHVVGALIRAAAFAALVMKLLARNRTAPKRPPRHRSARGLHRMQCMHVPRTPPSRALSPTHNETACESSPSRAPARARSTHEARTRRTSLAGSELVDFLRLCLNQLPHPSDQRTQALALGGTDRHSVVTTSDVFSVLGVEQVGFVEHDQARQG